MLLTGASSTCRSVMRDDVWVLGIEEGAPLQRLRWIHKLCNGTDVVQLPLVHLYWSAPREIMSGSDGFLMPPVVMVRLQIAK